MNIILETAERLRRIAVSDHQNHPQYQGHFDDWILALSVSNKTLKYKGGSLLVKNRWVLASPTLTEWFDPDNASICKVDTGILIKA